MTKLKAVAPERPNRIKNLTGKVFGRLTVIEIGEGRPVKWLCQCACGNIVTPQASNLCSSATTSCGCLHKELLAKRVTTHGHKTGRKTTPTYNSWIHMIQRCTNKNRWDFYHYGGRGITICEKWANSFENFLLDMGEAPEKLTLERIDVNGNYCPDNCRWATRKDQSRNQRSNKIINFDGKSLCLAEWSEKTNIPYHTLKSRLLRGWEIETALTQSIKR